jgi:hypothetical protein
VVNSVWPVKEFAAVKLTLVTSTVPSATDWKAGVKKKLLEEDGVTV